MTEREAFGYTVDTDDSPGRLLPAAVTGEEVFRMLREFSEYYPGAVASLARSIDPGADASVNGTAR